jgi:phospholipase/lecithinase/hemolysin
MLRRSMIFLSLTLVAFATPASAKGDEALPDYNAFFVFSDSLGDTGNDLIRTTSLGANPAIPPSTSPHRTYFYGRFSNGPILFEYFWAGLNRGGGLVTPSLAVSALPKKGALSFAYGGSTTGTTCFPLAGLRCQVEEFAALLDGRRPPKRALYAIFSGANDVLQAPNPFDPAVVGGIVSNIGAAVQRLYQLGARDVMVFNMPNLGRSPIVADPALKAGLGILAQQHNALLANALAGLVDSLPGLRVIPIDVYAFLESLASTSTFNFEVTALPPPLSFCLFDGEPAGVNCTDVPTFKVDPSYFFWDVEHPTTVAHAATGAFVLRELKAFFGD